MSDITLTKQQIFDLIKIFDHFNSYEDFTVTLGEDGMINIKLDSKMMQHKVNKAFVPKL